ncbi:MAG: ABC transporter ATP-binding protein [Helcococcus sp.]|nr:ABC transporter ATP-binding protein [Helcococcus sp.]
MSRINVFRTLLKEAWKVDKSYFFVLIMMSIFQAIKDLSVIYLPSFVIGLIERKYAFNDIILYIAGYTIVMYLIRQILKYFDYLFTIKSKYQDEAMIAALGEKTMSLSFKELENPETLDLIQRAIMPLRWGSVYMTLFAIKNLLSVVFTLISIATILIFHSPIYTLVIAIVMTISMITRIILEKQMTILIQDNVPINRKFSYYFNQGIGEEFQKEMRLFELSKLWINKSHYFNSKVAKWSIKLMKSNSNIGIVEGISNAIITFVGISYNALRLVTDSFGPIISIAQFTLIYNATTNLSSNLQVLGQSLSTLNTTFVHVIPWKQYITLEDQINNGKKIAEAFESLEFKNISFTYPNSTKLILDDISFKIEKGERISIVGLNNAGKSTIVKLISRFYNPDYGKILWNGVDIKEYEISSYFDQISAVFQDFKLMPYTIRENILASKSNPMEAIDKVNMREAIEILPKKLDTYLSKELEEDATKFSGGQAQKIAIARALNKNGSLMILDEPTAALDPLAESEIFENFAQLTKNKTAIFISHRMSSSTFSDKVLVLDGGKIAGFDTHKNLMQGDNLYRELFETQASNFE